jgi:chaperonin cofactor prefoldin
MKMSPLKEPSIADLDQASDQIKELIAKRPDIEDQLKTLRQHLVEMKVALSELEELRDEHNRGKLTEDMYLTRRMKLKTDYMSTREDISDITINNLLGEVKDQKEKSRLQKIKDAIKSNKDYILFLMEIGSTILKVQLGSP